jgi:hypothetical protein
MAAILEAVLAILSRVGIVINVVEAIQGLLLGPQFNSDLKRSQAQTALTYGLVTDGSVGLYAIKAAIDALTPITLPTTPPPGYGPDIDGTAAAVWGYGESFPGLQPAGQWLTYAGSFARRLDVNGLLISRVNPLFAITGWVSDGDGSNAIDIWPTVEVSSILADDTVLSWLTREEPSWDWSPYFGEGLYGAENPGGSTLAGALCIFTAAAFEGVKRDLGLIDGLNLPVWPGLDKVTIADPIDLAPGHLAVGPCEGVLIAISSVAGNPNFWSYGDTIAFRNIGAIAFYDDNGDIETFQPLGFTQAIYTPKTMALAAGIVVKLSPSVTASVASWVTT